MNLEKYEKTLESLKVVKSGPDAVWGWNMSTPFGILKADIERNPEFAGTGWKLVDYLFERLERAEANAKSETLADDVKDCIKAAMSAAFEDGVGRNSRSAEIADRFRKPLEVSK